MNEHSHSEEGIGGKRSVLTSIGFLFSKARSVAPRKFWLDLVLEPVGFLATVGLGVWLKVITDAATHGQFENAIAGAMGFAATIALMFLLQGTGARLRMTLDETLRLSLETELAKTVGSCPDLTVFEQPELIRRLDAIRQYQDLLCRGPGLLIVGVGHIGRLLLTAGILFRVHPLLIALPLLGVAPAFAASLGERLLRGAEKAASEKERLAHDLADIYTSAAGGTEIRLYDLKAIVESRFLDAWDGAGKALDRASLVSAFINTSAWIVFGLGFVGSIALVANRSIRGLATPGELLMTVYLSAMIAGHVQSVTWVVSQYGLLFRIAGYYTGLREYVSTTSSAWTACGSSKLPTGLPEQLGRGIRLEGVMFQYPQSDRPALDGISLNLSAGTIVALLGENGAGKSTLAKLLLGLYRPTQGRILIDGQDLACISPQRWRNDCSAAFQDFCCLELLASEAIGVGDIPRMALPHLLDALKRAGAEDLPEQLKFGLQTQLGSAWGGVDLSIGQWQKIALARAMMRRNVRLFILDEPTASLDAQSEHELFVHYAEMARQWAAQGVITILVSHRLSTVRLADLIVMMDHGKVVEVGTHRELFERRGTYAELLTIQARGYLA